MQLSQYFSRQDQKVLFSREQACRFAKSVANDFNAIHDADSSRFCVPGDLLFSFMLNELGLSQEMRFSFAGMVSDNIALEIAEQEDGSCHLIDENEKEYLKLERQGEQANDSAIVLKIIEDYVRFSGQNFPHILVPLLKEQGLMLNRKRPLVIYESMSLHFDRLDLTAPELSFSRGEYIPNGKKGVAQLHFEIRDQGELVGAGQKRMVLGKLLDYVEEESNLLISAYTGRRDAYLAEHGAK